MANIMAEDQEQDKDIKTDAQTAQDAQGGEQPEVEINIDDLLKKIDLSDTGTIFEFGQFMADAYDPIMPYAREFKTMLAQSMEDLLVEEELAAIQAIIRENPSLLYLKELAGIEALGASAPPREESRASQGKSFLWFGGNDKDKKASPATKTGPLIDDFKIEEVNGHLSALLNELPTWFSLINKMIFTLEKYDEFIEKQKKILPRFIAIETETLPELQRHIACLTKISRAIEEQDYDWLFDSGILPENIVSEEELHDDVLGTLREQTKALRKIEILMQTSLKRNKGMTPLLDKQNAEIKRLLGVHVDLWKGFMKDLNLLVRVTLGALETHKEQAAISTQINGVIAQKGRLSKEELAVKAKSCLSQIEQLVQKRTNLAKHFVSSVKDMQELMKTFYALQAEDIARQREQQTKAAAEQQTPPPKDDKPTP